MSYYQNRNFEEDTLNESDSLPEMVKERIWASPWAAGGRTMNLAGAVGGSGIR